MGRVSKAKSLSYQHQVAELRLAGKSFRQIATVVGISHQSCWTHYKNVVKELVEQTMTDAQEIRAQEAVRLTRLIDIAFTHIDADKNNEINPADINKTIETIERLSARLSALYGVDLVLEQRQTTILSTPAMQINILNQDNSSQITQKKQLKSGSNQAKTAQISVEIPKVPEII